MAISRRAEIQPRAFESLSKTPFEAETYEAMYSSQFGRCPRVLHQHHGSLRCKTIVLPSDHHTFPRTFSNTSSSSPSQRRTRGHLPHAKVER